MAKYYDKLKKGIAAGKSATLPESGTQNTESISKNSNGKASTGSTGNTGLAAKAIGSAKGSTGKKKKKNSGATGFAPVKIHTQEDVDRVVNAYTTNNNKFGFQKNVANGQAGEGDFSYGDEWFRGNKNAVKWYQNYNETKVNGGTGYESFDANGLAEGMVYRMQALSYAQASGSTGANKVKREGSEYGTDITSDFTISAPEGSTRDMSATTEDEITTMHQYLYGRIYYSDDPDAEMQKAIGYLEEQRDAARESKSWLLQDRLEGEIEELYNIAYQNGYTKTLSGWVSQYEQQQDDIGIVRNYLGDQMESDYVDALTDQYNRAMTMTLDELRDSDLLIKDGKFTELGEVINYGWFDSDETLAENLDKVPAILEGYDQRAEDLINQQNALDDYETLWAGEYENRSYAVNNRQKIDEIEAELPDDVVMEYDPAAQENKTFVNVDPSEWTMIDGMSIYTGKKGIGGVFDHSEQDAKNAVSKMTDVEKARYKMLFDSGEDGPEKAKEYYEALCQDHLFRMVSNETSETVTNITRDLFGDKRRAAEEQAAEQERIAGLLEKYQSDPGSMSEAEIKDMFAYFGKNPDGTDLEKTEQETEKKGFWEAVGDVGKGVAQAGMNVLMSGISVIDTLFQGGDTFNQDIAMLAGQHINPYDPKYNAFSNDKAIIRNTVKEWLNSDVFKNGLKMPEFFGSGDVVDFVYDVFMSSADNIAQMLAVNTMGSSSMFGGSAMFSGLGKEEIRSFMSKGVLTFMYGAVSADATYSNAIQGDLTNEQMLFDAKFKSAVELASETILSLDNKLDLVFGDGEGFKTFGEWLVKGVGKSVVGESYEEAVAEIINYAGTPGRESELETVYNDFIRQLTNNGDLTQEQAQNQARWLTFLYAAGHVAVASASGGLSAGLMSIGGYSRQNKPYIQAGEKISTNPNLMADVMTAAQMDPENQAYLEYVQQHLKDSGVDLKGYGSKYQELLDNKEENKVGPVNKDAEAKPNETTNTDDVKPEDIKPDDNKEDTGDILPPPENPVTEQDWKQTSDFYANEAKNQQKVVNDAEQAVRDALNTLDEVKEGIIKTISLEDAKAAVEKAENAVKIAKTGLSQIQEKVRTAVDKLLEFAKERGAKEIEKQGNNINDLYKSDEQKEAEAKEAAAKAEAEAKAAADKADAEAAQAKIDQTLDALSKAFKSGGKKFTGMIGDIYVKAMDYLKVQVSDNTVPEIAAHIVDRAQDFGENISDVVAESIAKIVSEIGTQTDFDIVHADIERSKMNGNTSIIHQLASSYIKNPEYAFKSISNEGNGLSEKAVQAFKLYDSVFNKNNRALTYNEKNVPKAIREISREAKGLSPIRVSNNNDWTVVSDDGSEMKVSQPTNIIDSDNGLMAEVKTPNGVKAFKLTQITAPNDGMSRLYGLAASYGNASSANTILKAFWGSGVAVTEAESWVDMVEEGTLWASVGRTENIVRRFIANNYSNGIDRIGDDLMRVIMEEGKKINESRKNRHSETRWKKTSVKGIIKNDDGSYSVKGIDGKVHKMTKNQKAKMDAVNAVYDKLGVNVAWTAGRTDSDGNINAEDPNGFFTNNASNTIVIDVFAGLDKVANADANTIFRTLGHETGHAIAKWNAEDFWEIATFMGDILMDEEGTGRKFDLNDYFKNHLDSLEKKYDADHGKGAWDKLSLLEQRNEAFEEMVCEGFTLMYGSPQIMERFAAEHKTLFQRIVDFLKNLASDIKAMLSGEKINRYEASILQKYSKNLDDLIEKMLAAMEKASENAWKYEGGGPADTDSAVEVKTQDRGELNESQMKNYNFNQAQTDVGSTLKTLNGSQIKRYKGIAGKEVGGQVYVHKNYADQVVPLEYLEMGIELLEETHPEFEYNCVMYDKKANKIRFDQAPDFDTAREPIPGYYISVDLNNGTVADQKYSDYIWHHKWLWVQNDYEGFSVKDSWEWSKQWLSVLRATEDKVSNRGIANGSGHGTKNWNAQLEYFGLPVDAATNAYKFQARKVIPIQSSDENIWRPTHDTNWFYDHGYPVFEPLSEGQKAAKEIEAKLEQNKGKNSTQQYDTYKTYTRLFRRFIAEHPNDWQNLRILDASSGLGIGTNIGRRMGLNITDLEPYPHDTEYGYDKNNPDEYILVDDIGENGKPKIDSKTGETKKVKVPKETGKMPMYKDYGILQDLVESGEVEQYDFIISNAVLNVVPQDQRDEIVKALAMFLKPGGEMFVSTINKNYYNPTESNPNYKGMTTPGNEVYKDGLVASKVLTDPGDYSVKGDSKGRGAEVFVGSGNNIQKVFSFSELRGYLQDGLGDGYVLETKQDKAPSYDDPNKITTIGMTGIRIRKNADAEGYAYKGDAKLQARDTEYMAAVESGDEATQRRIIDEVAAEKNYLKAAYHGTVNGGFTVFDKHHAHVGGNSGAGFYFSTNRAYSEGNYADIEGADNYFKARNLADQIIEMGEWNGEEVDDWDEALKIAKKEMNQNPKLYSVYLQANKPYIRNSKYSTDLIDVLTEDFNQDDYNIEDYADEDEYNDDMEERRAEEIYNNISNAVGYAIRHLEDSFEYVEGADHDTITSELFAEAFDYDSLKWNDIIKTLAGAGQDVAVVGTDGQLHSAETEFARLFIEYFGFDSIIDKEVSYKFNQVKGMGELGRDTEHVIVFDPAQIKLSDLVTRDDNGNIIPPSQRFNEWNEDIRYQNRDERYMEAVEKGLMDVARALVTQEARRNGYNQKMYHGTVENFYVFNRGNEGIHFGTEYAAEDRLLVKATEVAPYLESDDGSYILKRARIRKELIDGSYEGTARKIAAWVKANNPLVIDQDLGTWTGRNVATYLNNMEGNERYYGEQFVRSDLKEGFSERVKALVDRMDEEGITFYSRNTGEKGMSMLIDFLKDEGFDSIQYLNDYEDEGYYSWILFDSNQIKDASPVTYDDNGNVIPLSQRFNSGNDDIRYQTREANTVDKASGTEFTSAQEEDIINDDVDSIMEMPDPKYQDRTFKEKNIKPGLTKKAALDMGIDPEEIEMHYDKNGKKSVVYTTGKAVLEATFRKYAAENGMTDEQIRNSMKFVDQAATWMEKEAVAKYHFVGWKDIRDQKILIDRSGKKVILSARVKNGEYDVNFDFTKVCKKRVAFSRFIDELASRPGRKGNGTMLDEISLTSSDIFRMNEILKNEGYETACLGCFVEARRYNIKGWAETIVNEWNGFVDQLNPNAGYFNFANSTYNLDTMDASDIVKIDAAVKKYAANVKKIGENMAAHNGEKIAALVDEKKAAKKAVSDNKTLTKAQKDAQRAEIDERYDGMIKELKMNPTAKMLPLMKNDKRLIKKLRVGDLISSQGRTALHAFSPELESIVASRFGTNSPKSVEAFAPYNSEIELMSNVKKKKGMDDRSMAEYLFSIAGARSQSFSDFMITHVVDHLQKTAALAARAFPAHTYTKETSRVKLFGMTGEKHNMSVMFQIDPNVDWAHAGLDDSGNYIVADYENAAKVEAERNDGTREWTFSIPFRKAVEIEHDPIYSRHCGIVGVGYSYYGMQKMFRDHDIPYIIGYHRSGMPSEVMIATNIEQAADYTPVQNTLSLKGFRFVKNAGDYDIPSYATWKHGIKSTQKSDVSYDLIEALEKTGDARQTMAEFLAWMDQNSLVPVTSTAEKGHGAFDVYEALNRTMDPKAVANEYIAYCINNGCLPMFYEFANEENYYEILFDFSVTDLVTGETTPQGPVSMDGLLNMGFDNWIKMVDGYTAEYDKYMQNQYNKDKFDATIEKIYDAIGTSKQQDRESNFVTDEEIISMADNAVAETDQEVQLLDNYRKTVGEMTDRVNQRTELQAKVEQMESEGNTATTEYMHSMNNIETLTGIINRLTKETADMENSKPMQEMLNRIRKATEDRVIDAMLDVRNRGSESIQEALEKQQAEYEAKIEDLEHKVKQGQLQFSFKSDAEAKKLEAQAQEYRRRIAELRIAKNKRISEEIQKRQDAVSAVKEKQEILKVRKKIRKLIDDWNNRLEKPRKGHFIPKDMITGIIEALEQFDMSYKVHGEYRVSDAVAKAKAAYEKYKGDTDFNQNYNKVIGEKLDKLINALGDTRFSQLTLEQLNSVYTVMRSMHKVITDGNTLKAIIGGKTVYEFVKSAIEEMKAADVGKIAWLQDFTTTQLSPDNFFDMIAGFAKDSDISKLQQMFVEGEEKKLEVERLFYNTFSGMTNDEEFEKLKSYKEKDLVDVGLRNEYGDGSAIKITRAMMLALYMHLSSEDNFNGIVRGGLNVPDIKQYYKGQVSKAYGSRTTPARTFGSSRAMAVIEQELREKNLSEDEYNQQLKEMRKVVEANYYGRLMDVKTKIESMLTDYEMKLIEAAHYWFDTVQKDMLNQISMDLYGFKRAEVENYFPIHRDQNFIKRDFDSISQDFNQENVGFMKERVKASQPILLTDFNYEMDSTKDKTARYIGFVKAQRDFNLIYNGTMPGFETSFKEVLSSKFGTGKNKFGATATQYLENYVADIVGAREHGDESFLSIIRKNAPRSVLSANLRVAFSQLASIPTAAAEAGHRYTALGTIKGMRTAFSAKGKEELAQKNIYYWQRYKGEGGMREFADAKQNGTVIDRKYNKIANSAVGRHILNWCQDFDCFATAALYSVAEVWADNESGFAHGSEDWQQAVDEKYKMILRRTQPMYMTTARSDLMRSTSELTKIFTMYKTQASQNFNTLWGATHRYKAYAKALKNGTGGVTQSDVNEARATMIRSWTAIPIAAITFAGLRTIANFIMGSVKKYRDKDKDNEITLDKILEAIGAEAVDSLTSMIWLGGELYDILEKAFTGNKYYGISETAIGQMSEFMSSVYTVASGIKTTIDGKTTVGDVAGDTFDMLSQLATTLGIPVSNFGNFYSAATAWYDNIQKGAFFAAETGTTRKENTFYTRLAQNVAKGDDVEKLVSDAMNVQGKERKEILSKSRSGVKTLYKQGDMDRETTIDTLVKLGSSENDAFWDLDEIDYKNAHDGESEGYRRTIRLEDAIVSGNDDSINTEIAELRKYASGTTTKEQIKKSVVNLYRDGRIEWDNAETVLKTYGGYKKADDIYWVQKEAESTDSGYTKLGALWTAMDNSDTEAVKAAISEYRSHGITKKSLAASIKTRYIDEYLKLKDTDSEACERLLDMVILPAYEALGYSRAQERHIIAKNWK